MAYLQEGCPNYTERGNLCAIPLKKVKYKVNTKKQQIVIKTVKGSSPNKALSIHTASNPSQSREAVPLNRQFFLLIFEHNYFLKLWATSNRKPLHTNGCYVMLRTSGGSFTLGLSKRSFS
jgi:hypothetical protein